MKLVFTILLLVGCFFTLLSCSAFSSAGEKLTLIYSGNLDGELEPCGCSEEGNLGGIKRRATVLSGLREKNPQLIVLSSGGLLSSDGPGDRLKGEYILKGFAKLNYDGIGVQWRDLVYGAEFAFKEPLPWVISNWKNRDVTESRIIKRSGLQVAFFNWLNPEDSPMRQMQGKHSMVDSSPVRLQTALDKAKNNGELTVLATSMKAAQVKNLVDLDLVDILFVQAAYEVYGEPHLEGKTLVIQPGSRGMRLGQLDLVIRKEQSRSRVAGWTHTVIPMPESIKDAPEFLAWYDEYNARVKAEYLRSVETRKAQQEGKSPYTGEEVCGSCHVAQHKTWSESKHAIAFESLENVNKAYDPECIKCHTVGFEKPGGYIDMEVTDHLAGVQCESCHGAGRDHVESGGTKLLPNVKWPREKICGQCHVQKHSPSFRINQYWPKIKH